MGTKLSPVGSSQGGGGSIGPTTPTDFTEGSIPFAGAATLEENNADLFWDNTNEYLRIGTEAGSQIKIGETNAPTESGAIWMGQATPSSTNYALASSSTNNGGQTIIRSGAYTDIYGGVNRFARMQTAAGIIGVGLGYETNPIADVNVNIQPATASYVGERITLQGSQTADAFQVYSSGGTQLFAINAAGNPVIPTKTPASASATGEAGEVAWDSSFIYICVATNTWKRVAIATW